MFFRMIFCLDTLSLLKLVEMHFLHSHNLKFILGSLLFFFAEYCYSQAIVDRDSRFHPVYVEQGKGVVVSQEVIASDVGARVLSLGGNAVDAAVATGFALAVTFPQAGNLGGGGFMVIRLAEQNHQSLGKDLDHSFYALDYREVAPASFYPEIYLNSEGEVDTQKKRFSANSVGIPGTVAGLIYAQENWGKLDLRTVMQPAIDLAKKGFSVSHSLEYSLERARNRFQTDSTRSYFLGNEEKGYKEGELLVQEDLASTLERIANLGRDGFYKGETARLFVDQVNSLGGDVRLSDLENYQPIVREPVIGKYKGYEIISMPPPSSGGVHLIQMLNMLEHADFSQFEHNSADYIHLLTEVMKPAYADRSLHLGDPDFVSVPINALASKAYAKELFSKISLAQARPSEEILPTIFKPEESADTTHYSVWDAEGNMVSNTYTLNFSYGNGIAVAGAGFLLNNEMDDFSAKPGATNAYGLVGSEANSVQPGKRPLSSMTPTLVLKDSEPFMITGSPGGSRIITTVLHSILNAIEYDMNAAEIVSAPRFHHQWAPDLLFWEPGISVDTRKMLEQKGVSVQP